MREEKKDVTDKKSLKSRSRSEGRRAIRERGRGIEGSIHIPRRRN